MCDAAACCALCVCCDDSDPSKAMKALAGEFHTWLPQFTEGQCEDIATAYIAHYDVAGKGWLDLMLKDIRTMIHTRPRLHGLE